MDLLVTLARGYVRDAPGSLFKSALAARYLNPRLQHRPRRRVVDTRCGARLAVDTRDLIQRYLYLFGVWEPHLTRWIEGRLRPGDVFVDVGANVGYYSMLASRLVGERGRAVAIEAAPACHRRVLRHAELNRRRNVRAVNAAVSDTHRTVTFTLADLGNVGAGGIVPYEGPAEAVFDVEAYPLPELLTADEIAAARVIKIDVEGAEGGVIRGMAPMLDRLRPDAEITVEVNPARMAGLGDSAAELLETMRQHGFHAYRLANDYDPASYPAALRRPAAVPVRLSGPVVAESDLILSRIDAEALP